MTMPSAKASEGIRNKPIKKSKTAFLSLVSMVFGLGFILVGVAGLEPATTRTPCVYASQLRHTPKII